MDNNQNNNNVVNQEPVLQPVTNEQPVDNVQPALQPTVEPTVEQPAAQPAAQETSSDSESEENSETRLIGDSKNTIGINIGAYEAVKNKPKKVEKEFVEDPHAGSKRAFGFIFLFALVIFAFFLPVISDKISEYQRVKGNEELANGQLRCSMKKNTDNLSITYEQNFSFTNKQIYSYEYKEITEGSKEDAKEIEKKDDLCRNLDKIISGSAGVSITCDMTTTTASMVQNFNLSEFNAETVMSGFTEVGLTFPQFKNGQAVDTIKTSVQSAGYTCEKIS